ncbi:MAG TPA: dihydrofolate reductase family protein [Ktedonobacteraceae bacterium]|nr:dihydrofolate reductase family protein [Ktedonobacteraceae bacterium]
MQGNDQLRHSFSGETREKIVASMLMALDGVVENPQWTVPFRSEESQRYKFDELVASDALLLGRITYQELAAGWPGIPGAYGERINRMPKYVPTTTLQEAEWNATLIKDHIVEEVTRLKQESGQDLLIFGSVELIHSLMQEDLIDEYRLMVFPIVVGNGKRLFPGESQQKEFNLVQSHTFGSGVVVLTYEPRRKERGSEEV